MNRTGAVTKCKCHPDRWLRWMANDRGNAVVDMLEKEIDKEVAELNKMAGKK